jgi:uncharacterized protein YdiU (UPF0061 family)
MDVPIAAAGWRFDNSYGRLPAPLFSPAVPVPVREPRLVLVNDQLAAELGLDADVLRAAGAGVFAGNELPPGAEPIAQAYAGHQFGGFTNLGDGRAILLGEQLAPDGRRFDVQLKGAGRTRYSRSGDGRAALGPMLREYIVSEGMHALGIPTTRSLAVAATGEAVLRMASLPGAVLTRVAASHIRVGTFEYAAAVDEKELLPALLDHAIARHAPAAAAADDPAAAFLQTVVERQAALVARWMLVGFVHGVMNTDNMAVSGETIDYGPCAFLDTYDPATVFSSIDSRGRYAYANQPAIAQWNLARLAESLLPAMRGDEEARLAAARAAIESFTGIFAREYLAGGRAKLGLAQEQEGDGELFAALLRRMHETRADFTATFAGLAGLAAPEPTGSGAGAGGNAGAGTGTGASTAAKACGPDLGGWLADWRARLAREPAAPGEIVGRLERANPVVIPRNERVEEALVAAEGGDLTVVHRLLEAIHAPYERTPANEPYRGGPPPGFGPYCTFCGT